MGVCDEASPVLGTAKGVFTPEDLGKMTIANQRTHEVTAMGVCRWVSPALGTTGIRRRDLGWVKAGFAQVTGEEASEKQDLGGGAREAMQDGGEAGGLRPRPVSSDGIKLYVGGGRGDRTDKGPGW